MLGRPITAFRPGGDTGRLTIKNARLKLTVRGEGNTAGDDLKCHIDLLVVGVVK